MAKRIDPVYVIVSDQNEQTSQQLALAALQFAVQQHGIKPPDASADREPRMAGFSLPNLASMDTVEFMMNLGAFLVQSFPELSKYIHVSPETGYDQYDGVKIQAVLLNLKTGAHMRVAHIEVDS